MEKFLFGCAYYPEYFNYDRMDTDFAMMQEAGFNVIRIAESTWSILEKHEGEFDFSYIDAVLEKAPKYGLSVIIGTPTYAIPAWLAKKCPAAMVETRSGVQPYGRRQIFNLASEEYLFYVDRVVRTLIAHTAKNPNVIGFQIDNETKFYDNYGSELQISFVEELKAEFTDIEELNRTFGLAYWSNSIHSWEDFPDMKGCINAGLVCRYEEHARSMAAKYLKRQAAIVEEYRREDQFITHNLDFEWRKFGADIAQDGYSYGIQNGIHHKEVSQLVSLSGTDIYHPTQDNLTGMEIAFCGDEIRSLRQENYLVLEVQAQAFKSWCPYPNQLRLHLLAHIASGAMGLMYWNWHSIHSSFETYWKGVLSHDLQKNRIYREIAQIGEMLMRIPKERLCIQKQNKVAMLADTRSLTALQWFPIDRKLSYNDAFRYMYDNLYACNMECDILYSELDDFSGYDALICPALYSVSEELLKRLRSFVEAGGILIGSFRSFICDRNLRVYEQKLPAGLSDVFGTEYDEHTDPGRTRVGGKEAKYVAELLRNTTAKELYPYEHPYWSAYSAITENVYGKGKAYYLASFVDAQILQDLYHRALDGLRPEGLTEISQYPLIMRRGMNENGKRVEYVLNFSPEERYITISAECAVELLTQKTVCFGEKIQLMPYGAAVLEEKA